MKRWAPCWTPRTGCSSSGRCARTSARCSPGGRLAPSAAGRRCAAARGDRRSPARRRPRRARRRPVPAVAGARRGRPGPVGRGAPRRAVHDAGGGTRDHGDRPSPSRSSCSCARRARSTALAPRSRPTTTITSTRSDGRRSGCVPCSTRPNARSPGRASSRGGSCRPGSRSIRRSPSSTTALSSTATRSRSGPSDSRRKRQRPTAGCPSAAGSDGASGRRWPRSNWSRSCGSSCPRSTCESAATAPTQSCCGASRCHRSTACRCRSSGSTVAQERPPDLAARGLRQRRAANSTIRGYLYGAVCALTWSCSSRASSSRRLVAVAQDDDRAHDAARARRPARRPRRPRRPPGGRPARARPRTGRSGSRR